MANIIHNLQIIIHRGAAYGQEHESIAQALQALGITPADFEIDHPLIDLYLALLISARFNGLVYLHRPQRKALRKAIKRMKREHEHKPLAGFSEFVKPLRRQATADRLRLMVSRSAAYADEFEDVEVALEVLGCDFSEACTDDPLLELYRDLVAQSSEDQPRHLTLLESMVLFVAAERLVNDDRPA
jgi:hypothetical protein